MYELFEPGPTRDALISDLITAIVLLVGFGLFWLVRRNELWHAALAQVYRRRRISVLVLALFTGIALCDSIEWVGDSAESSDRVKGYESRSLLDRVMQQENERGYSAPFASSEFYEKSQLVGRHVFGTNVLGEDVFYLTLKGARVALLIGVLTSLITIPLALFFGISAGYFGGRIDDVVFFVMSTLASMPSILLLVALVIALGQGTLSVCIALGVTSWVGFARLSRGETLKLKELDYVAAARALGVRPGRIIVRHIVPNLLHLVVVTFVLLFSGLVLSEATLSWLGIGVSGSWGQMIAQAKDELSRDPIIWWNVAPAGAALFVLLLAINRVGDALRDVLDPRTRGEG